MCDCIEKASERLKKNIDQDAEIETITSMDFRNGRLYSYPKMNIIKPMRNKNGEKRKTANGKLITEKRYMIPAYCPFCGKPYKGN